MISFSLRVFLVYFVLLLATRIMGKREIGQLSSIDFVVAIVVAELSTIPITNPNFPLMQSIIPIVLITALQVFTSLLCLKSNSFRRFVYGKPNLLIVGGKIQMKEMRKARYNIDDLLTQLRQRDVFDIRDVDSAILETSGDLTVLLKGSKRPLTAEQLQLSIQNYEPLPIVLIDDGVINYKGLEEARLSEDWLFKKLARRNIANPRDVFFASLSSDGSLYVMKKEEATQ